MTKSFLVFLFLMLFMACKPKPNVIVKEAKAVTLSEPINLMEAAYNFENFDTIINLENDLLEISGLSYFNTESLLGINDEKGIIYSFSNESGRINRKIIFSKDGDYEGIECIDSTVYIIKSNGQLFTYDLISNKLIEKFNIPGLSSKNDLEGLAYDQSSKRLILALKGQQQASNKDLVKTTKNLCYLSLDDKKLSCDILISDQDLLSRYNKQMANVRISKSANDQRISRLRAFAPSGVAVDPLNADLYIVSAKGSTVVQFGKGNVKGVFFLNDKIIQQPEGICFDQQNNIYISTEGRGLLAKVFRFDYMK